MVDDWLEVQRRVLCYLHHVSPLLKAGYEHADGAVGTGVRVYGVAFVDEWCVVEEVLCLESVVEPETFVGAALVAVNDIAQPEMLAGAVGEVVAVAAQSCLYCALDDITACGERCDIGGGITAIAWCHFHQIDIASFVDACLHIVGIGLHSQERYQSL